MGQIRFDIKWFQVGRLKRHIWLILNTRIVMCRQTFTHRIIEIPNWLFVIVSKDWIGFKVQFLSDNIPVRHTEVYAIITQVSKCLRFQLPDICKSHFVLIMLIIIFHHYFVLMVVELVIIFPTTFVMICMSFRNFHVIGTGRIVMWLWGMIV